MSAVVPAVVLELVVVEVVVEVVVRVVVEDRMVNVVVVVPRWLWCFVRWVVSDRVLRRVPCAVD